LNRRENGEREVQQSSDEVIHELKELKKSGFRKDGGHRDITLCYELKENIYPV
jgi:hypothetical protein